MSTLLCTTALFLTLPVKPSWAQNVSWTGGTGDWSAGGNWSGGNPPTAADPVFVANGGTAEINSGTSAEALLLGLGYGNGTSGNLIIQAGGSLALSANLIVGNNDVAASSLLDIDGGILVQSGSTSWISDTGRLVLRNGGVIDVSGNGNNGMLGLNGGTLVVGEGGGNVVATSIWGSGPTGQVIFDNAGDSIFSTRVSGNVSVVHDGAGTTILSGVNTYTGGTTLNAGVVSVSQNSNLGAANGALTFNGGTLHTTVGFSMNRATTIGAGGGTFDVSAGTLNQAGVISGSGPLNKTGTGTLTLTGDSSAFDGTTSLIAGTLVLNGVLGGTIDAYGTSVLDAAVANAIGGFNQQSFYDNSTLNAKVAGAVSGGMQEFWNTSTLNANATDAVVGGMQVFNDQSVLNASVVGAIADGTQEFNDNSVLNASASGAISDGWQDFYGDSTLNASAPNAIVGGSQSFEGTAKLNAGADSIAGGAQAFWENGALNANGANAIKAGQQTFRESSVLNASATNAIAGGTQAFHNDSRLNATAENAINGGTQSFANYSILNAGGGSIAAGAQTFTMRSVLNAQGANAVHGGSQSFGGFTALNATAANAVSGGVQNFSWFATLNADAGSVVGGVQTFRDAATLNVRATNALAATTDIRFEMAGGQAPGGMLKLNGFSTTIGRIDSLNAGAGIITNDGATDAVLAVNTSAGASHFSGTLQNGAGAGKLGLTLTAGDLTLSGTNTYTGGTRIDGGNLRAGSATGLVSNTDYVVNGGTLDLGGFDLIMSSLSGTGGTVALGTEGLTVQQNVNTSFAGVFTGTGDFIKSGTGTLTLTGVSSAFVGHTQVGGGMLAVNGVLGGDVSARIGGALTGSGRITGDANLTGGGALVGSTGQTLRVDGNLVMDASSTTDVALAAPTSTVLFDVGGNLTLAGTLNVTDAGGFGVGVYRLFDYGGSLANNGLAIGTTPAGLGASDLALQTGVAGQVNLVNSAGAELGFWDGGNTANHDNGVVDGGSGYWRADGRNWTLSDGALNGRFNPNPTFAVFQGASGIVDVDTSAGAIGVTGMQFASNGYILTGDAITLEGAGGQSIIRVGDGTSAGASMTAIIDSSLTGNSMLVKSDLGLLSLSGVNTYTGGTRIDAGMLAVGSDASLGDAAGSVILNGGALGVGESFDTQRSIVLNMAGRFEVATGKTLGLAGTVSGVGDLVKLGDGTLTLTGTNTYDGNTLIEAGTLIGNAASIRGNVGNAATVIFDQGTNASFAGTITGLGGTNGAMIKRGAGDLTLTGGSSLGWTIETGGLIADATRFTGDAAIQTGARLTFDQNADATYAGILSGTGAVIKSGTVALTLTGDSSAFAGDTTISAGALRINGTLGGDVAARNSGVLSGTGRVMGHADLTGGGVIAGVSGHTLGIGGNLIMDATSTTNAALGSGSNPTLFDVGGNLTLDGTLNVTDAGGFGAGIYRLFDYSGALTDNGLEIGTTPAGMSTSDLLVQTAVSGRINLISTAGTELGFWDGGNPALHDNDVVDGGSGVWRVGGRNWTQSDGALNGPFQPNPTFAVFQAAGSTVTVDNSAGAVGVTGMQFAADGYRVEGDPIALQGAGGTTTIRVGDASAGGAAMTTTIASALTGASTLVKNDLGTLMLTGANSYTGGTQVVDGTLIGNSGSIRGDISNAATVVFDQATNGSFAGAIAGLGGTNGAMVKRGVGDLTLTGGSALGWTIETGGLIGNASRFGGNAAIQTGARLTFDQNADATYAGILSGSGSFALSGSGKVTMTGNSSAFNGTTTVGAGNELIVGTAAGGALGGSMTFGGGSLLGGTGTIGTAGSTVTILAGAVHAPGNSIGVQHIAGNYVNQGILRIEAMPTAADKIVVAGSVDITGAALDLVLSPTDASGWNVFNGPFTIIDKQSAGAVVGTFDPVTKNLLFLDAILDYAGGDGNDVTLQLERNDLAFGQVGNTRNQIATGTAIDTLGNGNSLWRSIALTNDPNIVRASFDALSGEIHASAKTALIEDSRFVRNAVNDRIRAALDGVGANNGTVMTYGDGGPQASAATTDRFAVWGQAFGSWGHMDSDGNAARLNRSTGGFIFGADAPVFDSWRFGAVAGYSNTSFKATDRYSSGSSDNYYLGLYGGTTWGDLAFRTGAAYTWHDISTNRTVAIPGVSDALKGDYMAGTTQVFGELGYRMRAGNVALEPFGSLAYVNFHTDGFTEKGGVAALTGAGGSTDTTFTTLGIRAATTFDLGGANLTARGMVGWRHAFGDVTPESALRFASGENAFSIACVPVARNAAVIEAGLDYAITPNASLGVSYNGQFGAGFSDQSVRASFNVKF
ncbi:autotransporter domain-containing protein [Brevundimonas faecalis]|uniref:autotransporter domain-containing protein n=1 Tax=Brevundimonas faecalis TaxID=947378 RepID=UPI00361204F2